MTLTEFESFTPREFQWRYDAEVQRENRQFERLAQLACWVLNPLVGGKLKARDLFGIRAPKTERPWWEED